MRNGKWSKIGMRNEKIDIFRAENGPIFNRVTRKASVSLGHRKLRWASAISDLELEMTNQHV